MRSFIRGVAPILSLLLGACGHSPPTTFLAIDPVPPTAPAAMGYRGPPLRVPFLHVPVTLDRPEFAREVRGTIAISDFDRWAAPLGLLARNTLIQDLQARLPAGTVLPPDAGYLVPEMRVEATVTRFHAAGAEAVMDVSYRLVRSMPPGAKPAVTPVELVTLRIPLSADTPTAQAHAWSAALGQLADKIVGELAANG